MAPVVILILESANKIFLLPSRDDKEGASGFSVPKRGEEDGSRSVLPPCAELNEARRASDSIWSTRLPASRDGSKQARRTRQSEDALRTNRASDDGKEEELVIVAHRDERIPSIVLDADAAVAFIGIFPTTGFVSLPNCTSLFPLQSQREVSRDIKWASTVVADDSCCILLLDDEDCRHGDAVQIFVRLEEEETNNNKLSRKSSRQHRESEANPFPRLAVIMLACALSSFSAVAAGFSRITLMIFAWPSTQAPKFARSFDSTTLLLSGSISSDASRNAYRRLLMKDARDIQSRLSRSPLTELESCKRRILERPADSTDSDLSNSAGGWGTSS